MIIQGLIIAVLLLVLWFILIQVYIGRALKSIMVLAVISGIVLTLVPEVSNKIANSIGVGRGVDLIFYLWILISLFTTFTLYASINKKTRQITELARSLALLETEFGLAKKEENQLDDKH